MTRFECAEGCSRCCEERVYYPDERHGKAGVLLLPEERARIRELARRAGVRAEILPRVGVDGPGGAPRPIAYQLMGAGGGDECPFLAPPGGARSPHGGRACTIYADRPLACRAYPVVAAAPQALDPRCAFCEGCGGGKAEGVEAELEALARIAGRVRAGGRRAWRYATGAGELAGPRGWVPAP